MIENSNEAPQLTKNPHGYGETIKGIMNKPGFLGKKVSEQEARNKVVAQLKKQRKNPVGRAILKEQRAALDEQRRLSLMDHLTGLYNRRHLGYIPDEDANASSEEFKNPTGTGELQREFDEAFRSGHDLSVFMIDIDDFKQYNDTYGHPEGDLALQLVANTIKKIIRDTDIPFRYGGEEIFVLSPETDIIGAKKLAKRLNEAIASMSGLKKNITVSIGIASYHNSEDYRDKVFSTPIETKEDLMKRSDESLYYSKLKGKNRATSANELTKEQYEEIEQFRQAESGKKLTVQE